MDMAIYAASSSIYRFKMFFDAAYFYEKDASPVCPSGG